MAKFNEIIYDIREHLKERSDDSEVDDRHLMYLVNTKRAKYLRQDLNNFQKATDLSIQQTLCSELIEVDADHCGVDLHCDKVLRTVKPLPKAIELHTKPAILKVKPTNIIAAPFNFISREKVPYISDSPFKNSVYAFLDLDNNIYFTSGSNAYKFLECINVTGVFENPLDLKEYSNCCGCDTSSTCFDEMESEYPLQPHYIDLIKMEIVRDLAQLINLPEDKINDSDDQKQK